MKYSEHAIPRHTNRPGYEKAFVVMLVLFGISLALSKSANNVLIAALLFFAVFVMLRQPVFRTALLAHLRQPLLIPLGVYIGVAILGLAFTTDLPNGIGIVNKMAGLVLIYLIVSVLLDSTGSPNERGRNAQVLLVAFLAGVWILDIIGVLTYLGIIGHRKYFLPLSALNVFHIWFANLNAVALYTLSAILLFSPSQKERWLHLFLVLLVPLAIFSILFSLSRTAWLGIFVTGIVLSLLLIRNKKAMYLMIAGIPAGGVLLYLFNNIVHSRMDLIISDISSYAQGHTLTNVGERFMMWNASIRMFLTNPLIGVGTGDYVSTMQAYIAHGDYPQFMTVFNQPHNMYLFALATNGLLGLLALLYLFAKTLSVSMQPLKTGGYRKMLAFLAVAVAVHYLAAGLTDSLLNIQILRYTFGFMMGVCVRGWVLEKE